MLKIPYHVCIKRCKKSYIFNTTLVTNFKKIRLKCGVRVATLYTVVYRVHSTNFTHSKDLKNVCPLCYLT